MKIIAYVAVCIGLSFAGIGTMFAHAAKGLIRFGESIVDKKKP